MSSATDITESAGATDASGGRGVAGAGGAVVVAVAVAVTFSVVVAVAVAVAGAAAVASACSANRGDAAVAVERAGCNGTVTVETVAGGSTDETAEASARGAACGIPESPSYNAVGGITVHVVWSNVLWLPSVVSTLQ